MFRGGAYISKGIVLGPSGGLWIESVSGETHTIGSGTTGHMSFGSSGPITFNTPQKQAALHITHEGRVGLGTTCPQATLHVGAMSLAFDCSGEARFREDVIIEGFWDVAQGTPVPTAIFHGNDISGIQFYRDVSMSTHKITNIMDASDPSGVPSWGQVQDLVAGGSGSYWILNGSDIFYNGGNVGIGTNTPAQILDVSGDSIFRGDMDMNTHQITNIMDATDPAGVPSLGQVHNLIDASSHWILNGNNITNDNTGEVIINQNLFVANDICSNRVITYTNDDFAAQGYHEFPSALPNALHTPRPDMSPLETNLVASERYNASQYPSSADINAKLLAGTTILVPIAICPVSVQQYNALNKTPNLGFNACAYFTIKLYDGAALNSAFVPTTPNLGRAAPLQQIHFIAGLINKDNSEGGGQILYEKIPFIKVLSNINLGRGAVKSGSYSQYPYYIDGLELWEDKTDTFAGALPYVPGNGTTYLILRLSADLALQKNPAPPLHPTQALFTDFNCYYDVRMYKDNTGLNDSISNNQGTPSVQPNDWDLLTAYQQLWLLGNPACMKHPVEWEDMCIVNGIAPQPNNYPLSQNTGAQGGAIVLGNWLGNLFSLAQGGQFNLNHLTSADVSLNIWLEEPYGITNTKEVFLDEVRCYSDVDIRGNTHVKDICCENIDVNNSIDVGPQKALTITEHYILSTKPSTNFQTGLQMEAHNFYYKINTPGIGSGFIINLNHTNDDKMFRIMQGTNWSTDTIFKVGAYGTTSTRDIIPMADLNYNLGIDSGPTGGANNRLRFKQLHIGDISCSFTIDLSGDLIVGDRGTFKSAVDICGNVTIDGNVDISGHTNLTDVSASNMDISDDLNVDGLITGIAETTFVEYAKRPDIGKTSDDWVCIARTKDTNYTGGADTARGLFILDDDTSGVREQIIFYAGTSYARGNYVNVIAHNWYGGPYYKNIRIDISGTYGGANLYVYKTATGGSSDVHIRLYQNGRPSSDGGRWVLTDASHANLGTTSVNLDISYDPDNKNANSASSLDHYIQGDMAIIGDISVNNVITNRVDFISQAQSYTEKGLSLFAGTPSSSKPYVWGSQNIQYVNTSDLRNVGTYKQIRTAFYMVGGTDGIVFENISYSPPNNSVPPDVSANPSITPPCQTGGELFAIGKPHIWDLSNSNYNSTYHTFTIPKMVERTLMTIDFHIDIWFDSINASRVNVVEFWLGKNAGPATGYPVEGSGSGPSAYRLATFHPSYFGTNAMEPTYSHFASITLLGGENIPGSPLPHGIDFKEGDTFYFTGQCSGSPTFPRYKNVRIKITWESLN